MFSIFFFLFACLLNVAYVKIGANECKCMVYCKSIGELGIFYRSCIHSLLGVARDFRN